MTAIDTATLVLSISLIAWGGTSLVRWLVDDIARGERVSAELRALKMDLANWAAAGQFSDGREYRIVRALAEEFARDRSIGW